MRRKLAFLGVVLVVSACSSMPVANPTAGPAVATAAVVSPASPVPDPEVARLQRFQEDGIEMVLPGDWARVEGMAEGLFQVRGTAPAGALSIYHGHPTAATVCDPSCASIDLPAYVPFSAQRTVEVLADKISALKGASDSGASDWVDSSSYHLRLAEARRLDIAGGDGRDPRRSYLIGTYATDVVVAVLVSSDDRLRGEAVEELLDGIRFFPRVAANAGVPVVQAEPTFGFRLLMPDAWLATATELAPGVLSYGDRDVTVSVPDELGILTICDPACQHVIAESLDELEAATFRRDLDAQASGATTLSDAAARFQRDSTTVSPSYRVIAVVDGVPIHLWFDASDGNVDPALFEEITASFRYVRKPPTVRDGDTILGEGFRLELPPFWQGEWKSGTDRSIAVDVGNADGWLWFCGPSDAWGGSEPGCNIRRALTLDALATPMAVGSEAGSVMLDGEPALTTAVENYEGGANGGQWFVFVKAIHDGVPYVIRLHNRKSSRVDLAEVLAGFRFTD